MRPPRTGHSIPTGPAPGSPDKILAQLQLRRAWQFECRCGSRGEGTGPNSNLCTEGPAAFRARLRGHVAAAREWGLDAADIGALAARNVYLIAGEPSALASRLAVLAAFIAPHSAQPPDSHGGLSPELKVAVGKQLRDVLVRGHDRALCMSAADLEELVANYVRYGLFPSKLAAREGCLRSPMLLRTTSWRVLVRKLAAVRVLGGSAEDEMTAASSTLSAERVLEAGLLREYSMCVPVQIPLAGLQTLDALAQCSHKKV
jgi:hypothetical protein